MRSCKETPAPGRPMTIRWLATLGVIMIFGLVMLFSASYTTGYLRMGDSLPLYQVAAFVHCAGVGHDVAVLLH